MSKGFTLIETIIASTTMALALTMVVMLVQQYSRVQRHSQDSLQRMAVRQIITEISDEARLAINITIPQTASPTSKLTFTRIRSNALPAIGNDPWPASRQMTVTYNLQQGELYRSWQWPGQKSQQELIASAIQTFEVSKLPNQSWSIKLNQYQESIKLWRD